MPVHGYGKQWIGFAAQQIAERGEQGHADQPAEHNAPGGDTGVEQNHRTEQYGQGGCLPRTTR